LIFYEFIDLYTFLFNAKFCQLHGRKNVKYGALLIDISVY